MQSEICILLCILIFIPRTLRIYLYRLNLYNVEILMCMFKYIFILFLIVFPNFTKSQHICFVVSDALSGEAIQGAVIIHNNETAVSNAAGYACLQFSGNMQVAIMHEMYQTKAIDIPAGMDTLVHVYMQYHSLSEVQVSDTLWIRNKVRHAQYLTPNSINKTLNALGEADVIKQLALLPGVSGGREGKSEIYVRGGELDQNLILIDGAPVFLSSHLNGYISAVNTDIVKYANFYSLYIPARLGGRLSSVLDITTFDGDNQKHNQSIDIGLLTSRLSLNGPIIKNKLTYSVSGRVNYHGLYFLIKAWLIQDDIYEKDYVFENNFFYGDVHTKVSYKPNTRHQFWFNYYRAFDLLTANGYYSSDYKEGRDIEQLKLLHTNEFATLGWQYLSAAGLYVKQSVRYSGFNTLNKEYSEYQISHSDSRLMSMRGGVTDLSYQASVNYQANNALYLEAGIQWQNTRNIGIQYFGGVSDSVGKPLVYTQLDASGQNIMSGAAYGEVTYKLTSWEMKAGLRMMSYLPHKQWRYQPEPRVQLSYFGFDKIILSGGYTRTSQLVSILPNGAGSVTQDYILLSSDSIPAQTADQIYTDAAFSLPFGIQLVATAYMKSMENMLYFQYVEINPETVLLLQKQLMYGGIGKVLGTELAVSYKYAQIGISGSYEYMDNMRSFVRLNNGRAFPATNSIKHATKWDFNWEVSSKIHLSAHFEMHSGAAFTLPNGFVNSNNFMYQYYALENMNSARKPLYHRLDVGMQHITTTKRGHIRRWNFHIYNVYARQNPEIMYYTNNKLKGASILSFTPSLSYGIKF